MTKDERQSLILDLLMQQDSLLVTDLSEQLNVSSVTIRKDLTELEKKKKLYRNHGKAILIDPYSENKNVSEKERLYVEEKRLIGAAAAQLITPRDSILIASGTTVHALARNIHTSDKLTVITASLEVARILANDHNIDIIELGGILRHSSLSVVGKYAESALSDFSCSKLFIGVDGIDLDFGITTTDMMEASLNRVMIQTAQKTIVLADSSKFGRRGFSKIVDTRGVPVPLDEAKGKVLYVWFDAPIGYISATKDLTPEWEKYWKDPETRMIHFIGKDNIVFHCIIFPAMLKAEGSYILPDNVPANEFLNLEGDKISTSRNWAVWLHEYLRDFEGKQDVLRYVLTANAPETKDNDFTWKDFQARNNSELVAIYGNFINRALVLTQKYFGGIVPERGELTDYDKEVLAEIPEIISRVEKNLDNFHFREGLKECMNLARLGNKYLADTEPWKLIKTDEARVKTILNICLQIAGDLSTLTEPFIPFSASKLRDFLNIAPIAWNRMGDEVVPAGHRLNEPGLLFEKIEDGQIQRQIDKLLATKKANEMANAQVKPAKENISFDDFAKLDIRAGKIIAAEKVAKTKKLMKLTIDTGIDTRTVVSGIAEYYTPEEVIGQQVSILVNLEPKALKGIESQGMILMAENADGSLAFVRPDKEVKNGSEIR